MEKMALTVADPIGSGLSMEQLSRALMRQVNCSDSDLRGAQMVRANVSQADLSRACMSCMNIAAGVDAVWPTNLSSPVFRGVIGFKQ
jgi:uncharacterized protein YjbI with pentapeptide repeats